MGCKEPPTYYPVGIFVPFQSDHHCVSYTVGAGVPKDVEESAKRKRC
ncbi:hypothetical protein ACQJBY_048109 [Aegilops geniculata]